MDINKMAKRTIKSKKKFYLTLGNRCNVIIYEFNKPKGEKVFGNTNYILYCGRFISRNNEPVEPYNCIMQIPAKTAWLKLYYMLKDSNRLDEKNLNISFIKVSNFKYDITIHDKKTA